MEVKRNGDHVIVITGQTKHEYHFNILELVGGEMQGTLSSVISSKFVGLDRNMGPRALNMITFAVRKVFPSGIQKGEKDATNGMAKR